MKQLTLKQYALFLSLLFFTAFAQAQDMLRGTVYDGASGNRMADVFIKNTTNNQVALTDKKGNFTIKAAPGHLLIFTSPTYTNDTLYVTNMREKRVTLNTTRIDLKQVTVTARANFNPETEYPEVYQKSKVYALSPSSWFSSEGRNARRLKKYFKREVRERKIDSAFSKVYVSSVIPLRGQELEDFMTMYRPSYDLVEKNDRELMMLYINDSYKKFMALPPEKRKPTPLGQ
ncbi:hypothetical protein EOD41_08265 [Mucilaginibacter limnophilus]|uniref:Carboxypeptidase-like regulatory domain-containing protein n=1 Tax=Mucilaginibacter limnophilus TaxID=1932778 RepID=A0A3S2V2Y5_9SPHI|nr:hypothetical protein [Mucilaginibacter limnophilus]RVU01937.1 hypothetical protein EOD41_08265 [Mucilaginibacter limnophilus]